AQVAEHLLDRSPLLVADLRELEQLVYGTGRFALEPLVKRNWTPALHERRALPESLRQGADEPAIVADDHNSRGELWHRECFLGAERAQCLRVPVGEPHLRLIEEEQRALLLLSPHGEVTKRRLGHARGRSARALLALIPEDHQLAHTGELE